MRKNLSFALIANIINAGFSWLLLLFLIRFGTTSDVGVMGLAQAIALPIHMFFTLKMRTIQASDVDQRFHNDDYVISRVALSTVNLAFTIGAAIILYFDSTAYIAAITALSIGYSFAILREYYISKLQIAERNDYLAVSNLVQGIFGLVLFVLAYWLSKDVVISMFALSISRIPAMAVDIYYTNKISKYKVLDALSNYKARTSNVVLLIKKSIPLGVAAVIGALFTSIPRLILEKQNGIEVLGVYTTVMSLIVILNLFMNSFLQAALPKMSIIYKKSKGDFWVIIKKSFLFICFVFSLGLTAAYFLKEWIVWLFFGESYISYSNEFFLSIVSGVILCFFHFGNFLLNVKRIYNQQVYIYTFCALICFFASWSLIPLYGLNGAIYATMLCSLTGFISCLFVSLRDKKVALND